MKLSRYLIPIFFAGLGGAINALLCYWNIPPFPDPYEFQWHIIPAGAVHGMILMAAVLLAANFLYSKTLALRFLAVPVVGFVAGVFAYAAIHLSVLELKNWEVVWSPVLDFEKSWWEPYSRFGLVSAAYYFFLCVFKRLKDDRLKAHLLIAVGSGIGGSLWWWIAYKPWYDSVIHGMIWGLLAGFGLWRANKEGGIHGKL